MKILFIKSSPSGDQSVSNQLATDLIKQLFMQMPDAEVVIRDLSLNPPPHWGGVEVQAAFTPPEKRGLPEKTTLALSDALCAELALADLLVVATPMWNFSIPSTLKAWIDHIVRVGVTFQYSPSGPRGLLSRLKTVYLVESSGGVYTDPAQLSKNHVSPYLSDLFRFIGAQEVFTIAVGGTAVDRGAAIQSASEQIQRAIPARKTSEQFQRASP